MGAPGPQAAAPTAEVAFERPEHENVLVRLKGSWVLASQRPPASQVLEEARRVPTRRIVFDTRELEAWDTGMLVFLMQVEDLARESKIEVDRSGLPEGVGRLLHLSETSPEQTKPPAKKPPPSTLAGIGQATMRLAGDALDFLTFLGEATVAAGRFFTGRARYRKADLLLVLQETGVQALPIVTLIAFLVGLIMAFVGAVQLQQFGATIYVANLVAVAMAREMGAMMTAIIMAGRTGAAFAAQLGAMKVSEEIDALSTMGLNPMEYLVLPRMLALTLMMPLLTVYADAVGMLGGAVVALGMLDISPALYWQQTTHALTLTLLWTGLLKSVVFGVIVAICGCLRGMRSGNSAADVGLAATSAVVLSIVLIVVSDGMFAVIFNILDV